ncbi:hypothetical protein D047_1405A, partial [Vibrio parahaemolyticus VPTS-2010_2]
MPDRKARCSCTPTVLS